MPSPSRQPRAMRPRKFYAIAAILIACSAVGCRVLRPKTSEERLAGGDYLSISPQLVRDRLQNFARRFSATLQTVNQSIADRGVSRAVRRRVAVMQLQAIEECRRTVSHEHPIAALLDTWTFVHQRAEFLTVGAGKDRFAEGQAIVRSAALVLKEDIESVAREVLDRDTYESASAEVAQFVREHPIDTFGRRLSMPTVLADEAEENAGTDYLERLVTLPMAPFSAMSGIERHAAAVAQFAGVADRFATTAEFLPEILRWQIELLLYDIEDRDITKATLSDIDRVATASLELSDTAKGLPGEIRTQLAEFVDEVGQEQGPLRETLAELRETTADLDKAIASGVEFTRSAKEFAASATAAGDSWTAVFKSIDALGGEDDPDAEPPAEPGRPFDIREYGEVAVEIARASADLRSLADQIHVIANSGEAAQAARDASKHVLAEAMWRGIVLIAVFFAAAVAYRLLTARFARSRSPSSGA